MSKVGVNTDEKSLNYTKDTFGCDLTQSVESGKRQTKGISLSRSIAVQFEKKYERRDTQRYKPQFDPKLQEIYSSMGQGTEQDIRSNNSKRRQNSQMTSELNSTRLKEGSNIMLKTKSKSKLLTVK